MSIQSNDIEFEKYLSIIPPQSWSHECLEGVILKRNNIDDIDILYLCFDTCGDLCVSESSIFEYKRSIIEYDFWRINPIPHFCTFENLYSILNKYSDNDKIDFIGISKKYYSDYSKKSLLDILYFKTKDNIFLEVIKCEKGFFWINETNNINDLHFNQINSSYRFFYEKVELKRKSFSINFILYSDLDILNITHNEINITTNIRDVMDKDDFIFFIQNPPY